VIPRDFDTIEIPFPERGAPRLVRRDPDARDELAEVEGEQPVAAPDGAN
jgi:hypothetical protein